MNRVCQKSDILINYIIVMSCKLQNTRYLHCLNNFNIWYYWFTQLCAQCVHPAAVQPKRVFRSVRWCTILLESPSVLTTLGSDIRQQSFTNNTFTVIRAVYFCSQFKENNAKRDANRNPRVMHLTRVENSNTKRVSLFWHTLYNKAIQCTAEMHCLNFYSSTTVLLNTGVAQSVKLSIINSFSCQYFFPDIWSIFPYFQGSCQIPWHFQVFHFPAALNDMSLLIVHKPNLPKLLILATYDTITLYSLYHKHYFY